MTTDVYIAHHGVKGMKWGVRKARKKTNTSAPRTKTKKAAAKKVKRNKPNSDRRMFDEAVDFTATMMGARTAKYFLGMPYAATAVSNILKKEQTAGRKAAEAVLIAKSAYGVGKIAYKIGQRNLERHNSMVNEIARENGYATYDWRGRRV